MNQLTILQIIKRYVDESNHYFRLHFEGYAEPGYSDPESGVIATGNWNACGDDNTMPRIAAILEKLGVELEWEDEWAECTTCYKLVRTQPDSYSWTRSYWQSEYDIVCEDCLLDDPTHYLEYLEGNEDAALTIDLDLESVGYRRVDAGYENGLYGGQCDTPEVIAESLRKQGIERFIFSLDSAGQFEIGFSVWVHKSDWSKLNLDHLESCGPDPAVAIQNALHDANSKMSQLEGEGIKVAKCKSDGTADVKLVSHQDFVDGKALD